MDLYTRVSYGVSRQIILEYSTSFSSSVRLFPAPMRPHIAALYGLVRIADEVVDTYMGKDAGRLLEDLEEEVYAAIKRGYSTNPVVHAFAQTARDFTITKTLIHPFFVSMQMDLSPKTYNDSAYKDYIYGSAEVIGLMCLKVFVAGDAAQYAHLKKGAQALGSAYQKVNFLRDIAADYKDLGRIYFPGVTFEAFDDAARDAIIKDVERDFAVAEAAIRDLPAGSKKAVRLSVLYYRALLRKIAVTPAEVLKEKRVRVSNAQKAALFARAASTRRRA